MLRSTDITEPKTFRLYFAPYHLEPPAYGKVRDLPPLPGMTWTGTPSTAAGSHTFLLLSATFLLYQRLSPRVTKKSSEWEPKELPNASNKQQTDESSWFCHTLQSTRDTIRRLSCYYVGLCELCRSWTQGEAFLLFWLWTVPVRHYFNKNIYIPGVSEIKVISCIFYSVH